MKAMREIESLHEAITKASEIIFDINAETLNERTQSATNSIIHNLFNILENINVLYDENKKAVSAKEADAKKYIITCI